MVRHDPLSLSKAVLDVIAQLPNDVYDAYNNELIPPEETTAFVPSIYDPRSFTEYIGQEPIKEVAKIIVDAAKKEKRELPPILIAGAFGLGKTTLARLIVNRFGKSHEFIAGLALARSKMNPTGRMIIDEIHNIPPEQCDNLNTLIDRRKLFPIGCTTNPGRLPAAFRSRFRILYLEPYTVRDLERIARNIVKRKGWEYDKLALEELGKRSRFTARTLTNNLSFCFENLAIRDETKVTLDIAKECLAKLGIDEVGLTPVDHRYLAALPHDRAVGLQYLSARLGIDPETIENEIEPFLMQIGLIDRNNKGRYLKSEEANLFDQLEDSVKARQRVDEVFGLG